MSGLLSLVTEGVFNWTFVALVLLGIAGTIYWLLRWRHKPIQEQENRDIHYLRKVRRDELGPVSSKTFKEILSRYIQHDLAPYASIMHTMAVDEIIDQLVNKGGGCFVFLGEVGTGKSALMQYMAYHVGKAQTEAALPFTYIDMAWLGELYKPYTLQAFFEYLREGAGDGSNMTIFLDSLERSPLLEIMTAEEFLHHLVDFIQTELTDNVTGLVISTREEVLPTTWEGSEWLEFGVEEPVGFYFFKLQPLSNKKIMDYFEAGLQGNNYSFHDYLAQVKKPVFAWPLALSYADRLLQGYGFAGLGDVQTRAETVKRLIYLQLKREYAAYKERPEASGSDLRQDDYINLAQSYIWQMIEVMLIKGRAYILQEELSALRVVNYDSSRNMIIAELMRRGARESGHDRIYSFVHIAFFELLVATYLLNEAVMPYDEQGRWLHHKSFSGIRVFYMELLKQGDLVPQHLWSDLTGWRVELPPLTQVTVEETALFWPFVDAVRLGQYELGQLALQELVMYREADFSDQTLGNLKDIEKLGRVEYLDISGTTVRNLRPLLRLKSLKGLDARRTDIAWNTSLSILEEMPLDTLVLSTDARAMLAKIVNLPLRRIFVETSAYSDVHIDIWEARQGGRLIALAKRTRPTEMEKRWEMPRTAAELPLLRAVFELEWECFDHKKNAETTYWNGLMLGAALFKADDRDIDKEAYKLLSRLAPYLAERNDQIGMQFHYQYGMVLCQHKAYEEALYHWHKVYDNAKVGLDQKVRDTLGRYMIRLLLNNGRFDEAEKIGAELTLQRAMGQDTVQKMHLETRYKQSGKLIEDKSYDAAERSIKENLQVVERYEGEDQPAMFFWEYHLLVVLLNRTGRSTEAGQYFPKLEECLNDMRDRKDFKAAWCAYHTEWMTALWLLKRYKDAYLCAQKIMNSPFREKSAEPACQSVITQYNRLQSRRAARRELQNKQVM
jgi:hypothetical protein